MILALESSGSTAGLALLDGETCVLDWSWAARGNHSVTLNRLLHEALRVLAVPLTALNGIVVSSGPGSFNGVRVGISLAKGLALATGAPLTGISTLDALAFGTSKLSNQVAAVIPAGRSEVFLGMYQGHGGSWSRTGEYRRLPVAEAVAVVATGSLLVGPATADMVSAGALNPTVESPWDSSRTVFLAELGKRYFEAGGHDRVRELEPLYLRLSAAEERRAELGGG